MIRSHYETTPLRVLSLIIVAVFGIGSLCGCSRQDEATASQVSKKPPVAVEVAALEPARLVEGIRVTGTLAPHAQAEVKTEILGLVREVFVTEWVWVEKGAPLARIDVAETEAQVRRAQAALALAHASLAEAEVAAVRAKREMDRARQLKAAGLATQQSVDDVESEQAAAKARVEAARAQVGAAREEGAQAESRLVKGLVRAPMAGQVALRTINVGDLASDAAAAKPAFTIVDNRRLDLTVTIPAPDQAKVRPGQFLTFTTEARPGEEFSGRVEYINPLLDSADRAVKVVVKVENDDERLKGGMFVSGRIIVAEREGVLKVPRPALHAWEMTEGKAMLFVIEAGAAKRRAVKTGTVDGDLVEIASGVNAGERYVVRGGFTLKDGDPVTVAEAKGAPKEASKETL